MQGAYRFLYGYFEVNCPCCPEYRLSVCNYQEVTVEVVRGNCPQCGVKIAVLEGLQDFHFHDLRHTFASHLVMGGVDITTVSKLLGHKSLTMTLRYAHLAPSHLVKAVEILDRQIGNDALTKNHNIQHNTIT